MEPKGNFFGHTGNFIEHDGIFTTHNGYYIEHIGKFMEHNVNYKKLLEQVGIFRFLTSGNK